MGLSHFLIQQLISIILIKFKFLKMLNYQNSFYNIQPLHWVVTLNIAFMKNTEFATFLDLFGLVNFNLFKI